MNKKLFLLLIMFSVCNLFVSFSYSMEESLSSSGYSSRRDSTRNVLNFLNKRSYGNKKRKLSLNEMNCLFVDRLDSDRVFDRVFYKLVEYLNVQKRFTKEEIESSRLKFNQLLKRYFKLKRIKDSLVQKHILRLDLDIILTQDLVDLLNSFVVVDGVISYSGDVVKYILVEEIIGLFDAFQFVDQVYLYHRDLLGFAGNDEINQKWNSLVVEFCTQGITLLNENRANVKRKLLF